MAAAAVVGRIDKSQKVQLFVVVVPPFVNVVFVVANYAQQQQQKKESNSNRRRSRMRRTSNIGAQSGVSGACNDNFCALLLHVIARGEGSGTWLIAVAQFTTATHCDCCRLGHDS